MVLTDSWDLAQKGNIGGNVFAVSLPGTTCNVKIAGCTGSSNPSPPALYDLIFEAGGFGPDTSSRLTAIGSKPVYFNFVRISEGGNGYYCQASAYSSVAAGNYIVMPWGCTKIPQQNNTWADCVGTSIPAYYSNLIVSYSCT
ncbi:MAG: hypothetical protein HYW50_04150 [Candidatus Diapherotrites archaeon]|nr:hypothetical protein [Candidatus Diapherotrites archaeon]